MNLYRIHQQWYGTYNQVCKTSVTLPFEAESEDAALKKFFDETTLTQHGSGDWSRKLKKNSSLGHLVSDGAYCGALIKHTSTHGEDHTPQPEYYAKKMTPSAMKAWSNRKDVLATKLSNLLGVKFNDWDFQSKDVILKLIDAVEKNKKS